MEFNPDQRKAAWKYRKFSIRDIQIEAILEASKKKLDKRIANAMKALYEGFVRTGKESIAIGAVLNSVTKALALTDTFTPSSCDTVELDAINKQSIGFQLITLLSEMGAIDLYIKDKTHMIKWTANMDKEFNSEVFHLLVAQNKFLKSKTISTDKVTPFRDKMLSQSSWYYNTPVASKRLEHYYSVVQDIKYKFKDFTGDEFIEAYKEHCDIPTVRLFDKPRINHLWEQIEASRENGGHYVNCMGDSVFRNYMMAEFGHFQTSHALRNLVEVEGIKDPIKYDATNSVMQMYALALKSGNLAQFVHLLEKKTGDFRTIIANMLNTVYSVEVFSKDNIKPIFMIWAYNAGQERVLNGSPKEIVDPFDGTVTYDYTNRSEGLLVIAEGVDYGTPEDLYNTFIKILEELVPEIFFLKAIFKKLVKGNQQETYTWTLPDGAIAQYANVTKKEQDKDLMEDIVEAIDSDGSRHIHTVYTKSLKTTASLAGLLPRVIHSIDAYIQRMIVVRAHAAGIVVVPNHDSFMFDKQHEQVMLNIIKEVYVSVLEDEVLKDIVNQLNGSKTDLSVKDSAGVMLTSESFSSKSEFGVLTAEDIMAGCPVEEEEL